MVGTVCDSESPPDFDRVRDQLEEFGFSLSEDFVITLGDRPVFKGRTLEMVAAFAVGAMCSAINEQFVQRAGK